MMAKVNVKGKDTHPVYQYLKKAVPGKLSNEVWWNFEKFLIVDGVPVRSNIACHLPAQHADHFCADHSLRQHNYTCCHREGHFEGAGKGGQVISKTA